MTFWNITKSFVTDKGIQTNENATTIEVEKNEEIEVKGSQEKIDVRAKDLIKDEKIIVQMFNKHYINTAEKTSRISPKNPGNPLDPILDQKIIHEIIENCQNHTSIINMKETFKEKYHIQYSWGQHRK